MQNKNLKSIIGLALMGLFLSIFISNDAFAQQDSRRYKKNKKGKVVTPLKHYSKQPRRGAQVTQLPRKTVVVNHRNTNFHYRNGIFYRPFHGSYIVATPPIGIRVDILPPNPFRVRLPGYNYYYYHGTYYTPLSSGGYEVVGAPVGAIVDALPDGYEVFELGGRVYYRLDQTYYKAVIEPNGNVVYQVVQV